MTDHPSPSSVEARLSAYLSAELRRAEQDYPTLAQAPRTRLVSTLSLGLVAIAVAMLATLVLLRPLTSQDVGSGPLQLGSDGLPLTIAGEPVLRGAAIAERLEAGDGASFLAGGRLVLQAAPCSFPSPANPAEGDPCPKEWWLEESTGGEPAFPLVTTADSAEFVRTSGALTVFRVVPAADVMRCRRLICQGGLMILSVAWRQPTKGPIPPQAIPTEGGEMIEALVPDFVSTYGQDGETIAGYIPKAYLLRDERVVPGTPDNPPADEPIPVYGEDLVTLVGYQVPGLGFVPLSTGTDGGISRDRAIELALSEAPPGAEVVSGEIGELGRLGDPNALPDEPRDRLVWAIVLRGTFAGSCPMTQTGEPACPPDAESMLVILDYATGEFLYSVAPAS